MSGGYKRSAPETKQIKIPKLKSKRNAKHHNGKGKFRKPEGGK